MLNKQPGTRVTHAQIPWLVWEKPSGATGIPERLQRLLTASPEQRVGDVASFYLPYVAEAIASRAEVRIICLKRPRDEVVDRFCRFLDQTSPLKINHWATKPAEGWHHDPFETRIYPQYETVDREEGIGRYWDEYYASADELQRKFPENLRIWDAAALTTAAGVREILTFAGIPPTEQVVATSPPLIHLNGITAARPAPATNPLDPRKCVILVPFAGSIHRECDESLKALEERGYQVRRVAGYAAIDQARNQMATDALRAGFEETLWIDSDIGFHPDSVERLRSHGLPLVCGVYPKKGMRALACHVLPGTKSVTFGREGGLVEILYAATGFLLVRREAYLKIQNHWRLPVCNERFAHPMIPFFQPLVRTIDDGYWYLAEDYAFSHRAREAGLLVFADTSIRLWHFGATRYGWEDAGGQHERSETFTLNLEDTSATDADVAKSSPANPAQLQNSEGVSPFPALSNRKDRPDVALRLADAV